MTGLAKRILLAAAAMLALVLGLLPFCLRRGLVSGLLLVESRIGGPDASLRHLFALWDDLDRLVNERATAYGQGINPKHRLTRYHDFFIERIPPGSRVLDVGCGVGAVARNIAERVPGVEIVGIDADPAILAKARAVPGPANLSFVLGLAGEALAGERFDVLVLSNVLEHVERRVELLRLLIERHAAELVLIRVPLFERHWHMPLRRELGVNHLSDPTHFIEHALAEFEVEMAQAGLDIGECRTQWGEIWASCRPESNT